jgi:hypothetical protein
LVQILLHSNSLIESAFIFKGNMTLSGLIPPLAH